MVKDHPFDAGLKLGQVVALSCGRDIRAKRTIGAAQSGAGGKGPIRCLCVGGNLAPICLIRITNCAGQVNMSGHGREPQIGLSVESWGRERRHYRRQAQPLTIKAGDIADLTRGAETAQQRCPVL